MSNVRIGILGILFVLALSYSPAVAQTPDGQTPAQEDVCNGLAGAAFGLCNAYCEAMDCETANPQASQNACDRVFDNFVKITGTVPPCEAALPVDCVVSDWSDWSACSAQCDGGTQTRTRTIQVLPEQGGAECPPLQETRACNLDPCPVGE